MSEVDYSKMSEDELNELLVSGGGVVEDVPEKEAEPSPTPAVPEEIVPPVEEEKVAPQEPTEPDERDELATLEAQEERVKRERLEAQLQLQMAHNSRLAGKLGFLENQVKSISRTSEPYEPQSQVEVDRLSALEARLEQSEALSSKSEVSQAVERAVSALDGPWVVELAAEIAEIAPRYVEQLKAAQETSDPDLARQIASAVALTIKAEAQELAWSNRKKSLIEKRSSQVQELSAKKKAATISGGGGTSVPRPAPKTYDQMTPDELEAEMQREFSRR